MFGFGPKRPLSADEWDWQLAAFKWLEEEFGNQTAAADRTLALPNVAMFPPSKWTGRARVEELLARVQALTGLSDWPVRIDMIDSRTAFQPMSGPVALSSPGERAAGTFQLVDDGQGGTIAEIRIDVHQLDDEMALIATLAHELAHYLLSSTAREVPGGEDCHELLTDLTAVYMGFGVFLGNSARYGFHTTDELGGTVGSGWYLSGWQGYLSERALMTALAISETLAGRDPLAAKLYLKPHLTDDVRRAFKYIQKCDLAADMAAIDLAEYGAAA